MPSIDILSRFRGGLPLAPPTKSNNSNNQQHNDSNLKFSNLLEKELLVGAAMQKVYLVISEDANGNYYINGVATSKLDADKLVYESKIDINSMRINYRIIQMDTNSTRSGFPIGGWKLEGNKNGG